MKKIKLYSILHILGNELKTFISENAKHTLTILQYSKIILVRKYNVSLPLWRHWIVPRNFQTLSKKNLHLKCRISTLYFNTIDRLTKPAKLIKKDHKMCFRKLLYTNNFENVRFFKLKILLFTFLSPKVQSICRPKLHTREVIITCIMQNWLRTMKIYNFNNN